MGRARQPGPPPRGGWPRRGAASSRSSRCLRRSGGRASQGRPARLSKPRPARLRRAALSDARGRLGAERPGQPREPRAPPATRRSAEWPSLGLQAAPLGARPRAPWPRRACEQAGAAQAPAPPRPRPPRAGAAAARGAALAFKRALPCLAAPLAAEARLMASRRAAPRPGGGALQARVKVAAGWAPARSPPARLKQELPLKSS